MKYDMLVKGQRFFPLVLIVLFYWLVSAFQVVPDSAILFVGKWKVKWVIKNPELAKDAKEKMNGYMEFKDDGVVSVQALGFPGCIFSSDTIENELMWQISNDSLHLYNKNDQFKLSYLINKASPNLVELKLLDDIFVTLKR